VVRRRQQLAPLRRRRAAPQFLRRARRPRKNDFKKYAKKAAFGTAAGLAVSIPLTLLGQHMQIPELIEAGQRIGSVASTAVGGTVGNAAYQGADALFDRVVPMLQGGGYGVTGGSGVVYL